LIAHTVPAFKLPFDLDAVHMDGFYAGRTTTYSEKHKHRIKFAVWSKGDVQRAARRLWGCAIGEDIAKAHAEGIERRKRIILEKLKGQNLAHYRTKATRLGLEEMKKSKPDEEVEAG
jgi:hypothetical protein